MKSIMGALVHFWGVVPPRWRTKPLVFITTLAVSRLVILIWGPGYWIGALLLISFGGAMLRSYGVRGARHADALLGKVWDYFRGAVIVAMIPALWPVLQEFREGDVISAMIQLMLLAIIVAVVFEQFNQIPRTWIAMSLREARPRTSRRGSRRRSRRS